MNSKIKIFIGVLIALIISLGGFLLLQNEQSTEIKELEKNEKNEKISMEDAYEIVVLEVLEGDIVGKDIYVSEGYLISDDGGVELPNGDGWYFFIDDNPEMDWAHPCRYIYIDNLNNVTTKNSSVPPENLENIELLNSN